MNPSSSPISFLRILPCRFCSSVQACSSSSKYICLHKHLSTVSKTGLSVVSPLAASHCIPIVVVNWGSLIEVATSSWSSSSQTRHHHHHDHHYPTARKKVQGCSIHAGCGGSGGCIRCRICIIWVCSSSVLWEDRGKARKRESKKQAAENFTISTFVVDDHRRRKLARWKSRNDKVFDLRNIPTVCILLSSFRFPFLCSLWRSWSNFSHILSLAFIERAHIGITYRKRLWVGYAEKYQRSVYTRPQKTGKMPIQQVLYSVCTHKYLWCV